jgi:hypothetical protein
MGQVSRAEMTSPGGKITALACYLTKKVNKAEEITYLSTNIESYVVQRQAWTNTLAYFRTFFGEKKRYMTSTTDDAGTPASWFPFPEGQKLEQRAHFRCPRSGRCHCHQGDQMIRKKIVQYFEK